MTFSLLLEAALRSFLLALAVWIGLRVFRVRNVPAQKAAWGVVLASALAMPVVLPMTEHWSVLPANVRVVIPADPQTILEELQARIQATPSPQPKPPALAGATVPEDAQPAETLVTETSKDRAATAATVAPDSSSANSVAFVRHQPVLQPAMLPRAATPQPPLPQSNGPSLLTGLLLLYVSVAGLLFVRIIFGLIAALWLLRTAKAISADSLQCVDQGCSGKIRSSAKVASPVTICSSIVLPSNYETWDSEKLRIVLAHERSHVRQGDFYLQLLAGVYAAAVWFSPLGWWLKRKLSDLAEAISDRAGLEEAADRTSYAQVLLEFAAAPRPTLIGVAMARSGSLSRRIERLLNDVSFGQAFSDSRRSVAAVLVIPVALFAASALVRIQAAGQAPTAPPPPIAPDAGVVAPQAPSAPPAPNTEVSPTVPASPARPAMAPAAPAPATAPELAPLPPAVPAEPPAIAIAPVAPHSGSLLLIAPKAPGSAAKMMILPDISSRMILSPMTIVAPRLGYSAGYGIGAGQSSSTQNGSVEKSENGKRSSYRYSYSSDGDSYAIVRGDGSGQMSFNGDIHTSQIDKVRKQAHGDFLWFTHDGKSYFVDDPATISQIEGMYKPMEELGRQQEELGKKQEALGKQQEELGKQQEAASVPTPDMSREIAEIDAAMAKLKASQGKNITQDQFAEIQEKLGELQGKLGEIQGRIGSKQGEFGERMGELGAKMGELGAQQGELGAKQGRIAEEADRKVKSIIDESLKNGKAHPVQ